MQALLLENTRFHAGDTSNSPEFSKALAKLCDVFVMDAFGVSHRDQGSVTVGMPAACEHRAKHHLPHLPLRAHARVAHRACRRAQQKSRACQRHASGGEAPGATAAAVTPRPMPTHTHAHTAPSVAAGSRHPQPSKLTCMCCGRAVALGRLDRGLWACAYACMHVGHRPLRG
jgi:hypothetical protein